MDVTSTEDQECNACARAAADPHRGGIVYAACFGCAARGLVTSRPDAVALAGTGQPAELQELMRKVWPEEAAYARGRVQVWKWIRLIAEAKERSA